MQLKIDFESHSGEKASAKYDDFSLADQVITAMNHSLWSYEMVEE